MARQRRSGRAGATEATATKASPFYGIEGQGWFLSFHTFTHYVKVTFFKGASLRPLPPGASKHKEVRYLDIREDDTIDEAQLASWIKQAAAVPGWMA